MKTDGRIVLCAGLKSSGSTWLYNAVVQLVRASGRTAGARRRVRPFYAEDLAAFPSGLRPSDCLIVKTHVPSPALRFLARFTGGPVFISIREPRDAIASLMQRFNHDFDVCLEEVSAGAAAILELANSGRHLLLRYEDRFTESRRALAQIASHLGTSSDRKMRDQILADLEPTSVVRRIVALRRKGTFGREPDPNRFDPLTHWHPGHVGDGRVGKYGDILSSSQQRKILKRLDEYCQTFGYPASTASRMKQGR